MYFIFHKIMLTDILGKVKSFLIVGLIIYYNK